VGARAAGSAAGARHAEWCRAARPDARAKEQIWTAAMTDLSLSNHQVESYAGGFWQPEQVTLCAAYADRYFAEIDAAWTAHTPQLARSLAGHLYPAATVDPSVDRATDAFLDRADLPAGLRRVVLERQDELRRAIAVRALAAR
jgi:aminopeptidase N